MSSVSLGNLIPYQIGGFIDMVCLNEKYLILNLMNFILKKIRFVGHTKNIQWKI